MGGENIFKKVKNIFGKKKRVITFAAPKGISVPVDDEKERGNRGKYWNMNGQHLLRIWVLIFYGKFFKIMKYKKSKVYQLC